MPDGALFRPPPEPPDPLLGVTLGGRYKIVSLLGRGGMSRVYQAVQAPLGRAVALKVLRNDPHDSSLQRRFLFEAKVTSQLSHPNTITIFDYGVDQGQLFFAMELLRGRTLQQALRQDGAFPQPRALHVARQVCRSLREAHALGLVHRDLKPSNVFLLDRGDEPDLVKVLDFGLVKMFGAEDLSAQLTPGGSALGTPHYMAPEQARGRDCDQRSDIYSLGVVLFQLLTGKVPFDGPSSIDVLLRHATEPAPRMAVAAPGAQISEELEIAVARCLAKKPDDRFHDMDELLAALPSGPSNAPHDHRAWTPPPPPLDEVEVLEDVTPCAATGRNAASTPEPRERRPMAEAPAPAVASAAQAAIAPAQPSIPEAPAASGFRGRHAAIAAGALAAAGLAALFVLRVPARPIEPAAVWGSPATTAPVAANAERAPIKPTTPAAPAAEEHSAPRNTAAVPPQAPQVPAAAPAAPEVKAAPPTAAADEPEEEDVVDAPARRAKKKAAKARAVKVAAKAVAPLSPASAEVVASLRERLGRAVTALRQCALIEERRDPGAVPTALGLKVTVGGSGRVVTIAIEGPQPGGDLEQCVRAAVLHVSFEAFPGAPVLLERTIALSAR